MSRVAGHEIDPMFLERWSPRALSADGVTNEDVLRVFEAARWAPSSNNAQPWRFVYALHGTPAFAEFLNVLVEFNQLWARNAGALVVIASKSNFDNGNANRTAAFDTGSAWMSAALQADRMGLHAHGMAGFDYDRAKTAAGLPDGYEVQAMFALGRPASPEVLPERMRKGEVPSSRKPLADTAFEGRFISS